ncbi:DUF3626 domain-containing protein [uncultured Paludibaculum sp.]|uniref:DUF3626 domain-containing protein n=1 Tax=uncultured Paludibaculum sp. TaxID=1765020 RepID=UPI002AAC15E1|nr:DUF3626 domain-containing protein [uncultured Paludibaculum sp.]
MLSAAQSAALRHVESTAESGEARALESIAGIFERAGYGIETYREAIESIRQHARIALHFHPDRLGPKAVTVAESLLSEGVYRNQFETGLSSGSPTAYQGGERDLWERSLFGGAYHAEGVLPSERPKYGSLELVRYPDGPAPRFGSCYFVLRDVGARTSITFMGSEHPQAGDRVGTLARPHGALAALLSEIENGGMATPDWPPFRTPTLGMPGITVGRFCDLARSLRDPRPSPSQGQPGRLLDTGVEAQVHGPIVLNRDVELLVADPAFAASPTGQVLQALAQKYGFELMWHCGFRLPVVDVPDDFRGPAMPKFAQRVAGAADVLDAAVIGQAAASLYRDPAQWSEWGDYWEIVRLFRQIWHVLVHFGHRYEP